MRNFIMALLLVCSSLSLCGCFAVLIGAGVAGGIAISEDTAKLEVDTSVRRAWGVAYKVVEYMGAINLRDKEGGKIEAIVQESKVTVTVVAVTSKSVRIEVKARKNLLPNVDLAMEIINKINGRL